MANSENETKTITKGIDLATKEFQDALTFVINSSGLPPVITKYVLKDLLKEIENVETNAISVQSKEYLEQLDKQNKKDSNKETKQEEEKESKQE